MRAGVCTLFCARPVRSVIVFGAAGLGRSYGHTFAALRQIAAVERPSALWRASLVTLSRDAASSGLYLALYRELRYRFAAEPSLFSRY